MRNSFIIIVSVVVASLFETGCASNQATSGSAAADNQQERTLGGRTSRINMQIGPPECTVR